MKQIRVSIVEDLPEIRQGMEKLLRETDGMECLSAYPNITDALEGLPADDPDIVIMDLALPDGTGIDCMKRLRGAGLRSLFVVFTIFEDSQQVFEALQAGASGYLLKNASSEEITVALRDLAAGGSPMSLAIARKVVASFHRPVPEVALSPRESEVLQLLSKGFLYKEIAAQLGISIGTVRQHIHHIYEKLHVQNRTEAINKAFGPGH